MTKSVQLDGQSSAQRLSVTGLFVWEQLISRVLSDAEVNKDVQRWRLSAGLLFSGLIFYSFSSSSLSGTSPLDSPRNFSPNTAAHFSFVPARRWGKQTHTQVCRCVWGSHLEDKTGAPCRSGGMELGWAESAAFLCLLMISVLQKSRKHHNQQVTSLFNLFNSVGKSHWWGIKA